MSAGAGKPSTIGERRRARRLAIWNGAIWALGNGLASTTLIVYLARELHSERLGLGIGLILAAPQLVGLLRVATPALIQNQSRKTFCLASFLLSAICLAGLPWLCRPGQLPSPGWSLAALVTLWCVYHLLQYLAMVALWTWLGDMARVRIRGRFFGRRERWMVAATAAATVAAGLFVWGTRHYGDDRSGWLPYAVMAALGALMMLAALVPLSLAPSLSSSLSGRDRNLVRAHRPLVAKRLPPLRNRNFLMFLLFGCWFSFFNGITQSAQDYFSMQVLGVSLLLSQTLRTGMRLGQGGVSRSLGAMADRLGNRPVMITCQCLVAAGLACLAAATPERWYWILGAWALWIAYAGLNIAMPNLLLQLAPPGKESAYVATFEGVRGVFYAASTVLGGFLVDRFRDSSLALFGGGLPFFAALFLFGAVLRGLGVLLLLPVKEPLPVGTALPARSAKTAER